MIKKSKAAGAARKGNKQQEQEERLLQQQDALQNQNEKLDSAQRALKETEQIASEIGDELQSNRETIESAKNRVHQVTTLTGRAKRVVASMNRRSAQQKRLVYGLLAASCFIAIAFFVVSG